MSIAIRQPAEGKEMRIWSIVPWIAPLIGAATSAHAQDAYKWSDTNCTESRLVPLQNTKCRATNVVSGGDSAGGQFRGWSQVSTSGPFVHVFLQEALASQSYIYTRDTGPDYLKRVSGVAKDGLEWREAQRHDGADYYLFRSSARNECVGFRRYGPARSLGYAWIMAGVTCAPKGSPLDKARITEFIESAKVR